LTAEKNLPTPYPTVPSPTPYDVSFSHSTFRYRQRTDDRKIRFQQFHPLTTDTANAKVKPNAYFSMIQK